MAVSAARVSLCCRCVRMCCCCLRCKQMRFLLAFDMRLRRG